ncbi:transposase [Streptomyces milbemycinicus]
MSVQPRPGTVNSRNSSCALATVRAVRTASADARLRPRPARPGRPPPRKAGCQSWTTPTSPRRASPPPACIASTPAPPTASTNCQIGIFAAYVTTRGRALVDREPYPPKSWTDNRDRCRAAHIPGDRIFATKPDLAKAIAPRDPPPLCPLPGQPPMPPTARSGGCAACWRRPASATCSQSPIPAGATFWTHRLTDAEPGTERGTARISCAATSARPVAVVARRQLARLTTSSLGITPSTRERVVVFSAQGFPPDR